ncbi:MAG TPA: hypothetical protein VFR10_02640, partial [bacterium]|nr:hypothetical protein [bacterium]
MRVGAHFGTAAHRTFHCAILAAAILLLSCAAAAHDFPTSHIDLQWTGDHFLVRATIHAIDLAHDLGPSAPEDS